MIERHEGRRNKLYTDSEGIPTIGIGHNLLNPISNASIDQIFEDDLHMAIVEAQKLDCFVHLDPVRQDVLISMVFNMGLPRVLGFKKMLAALAVSDWFSASQEMLTSRWAGQVGNRAIELAGMIKTGTYAK